MSWTSTWEKWFYKTVEGNQHWHLHTSPNVISHSHIKHYGSWLQVNAGPVMNSGVNSSILSILLSWVSFIEHKLFAMISAKPWVKYEFSSLYPSKTTEELSLPLCMRAGGEWPIRGQGRLLPVQVSPMWGAPVCAVSRTPLTTIISWIKAGPNASAMDFRLVLMLVFTCWSVLHGHERHIYTKLVDLVSPGEKFLCEDALVWVIEGLENRVQCSGVSCGKVRYVGEFWRGRGPGL